MIANEAKEELTKYQSLFNAQEQIFQENDIMLKILIKSKCNNSPHLNAILFINWLKIFQGKINIFCRYFQK